MSSILFEKKRVDINSVRARLAAILISLCTVAYFINMPVMLGLAGKDLGLSESQILMLAGTFIGGMVLASILSILFIRIAHWQRLVMINGLMAVIAFLVPVYVSGVTTLLVCQSLAGLFVGFGYSVAIACLGDTANPTRNYALAFAAQTAVVAFVSYQVPQLIESGVGFKPAMMAAAALAFVSILLGKMIPGNGRRASLKSAMSTTKSGGVYLGLLVMLLVFVGGSTVRGSVEPIASRADMDASGGSMMVILLMAGAFGSLMAAVTGDRFGYIKPVAVALGISALVLVLGVAQMWPDQLGFVAAFCLIAWAWNFAAAYIAGALAKLNGDGRLTPLIVTTQVLGSISGIFAVGFLAVGNNHVGAYLLAIVVWVLALVIFIPTAKRHQKALSAESATAK